jgi:hypothetical protein
MSFKRGQLAAAYIRVKNMSPRDPEYVYSLETALEMYHEFYQWFLAKQLEELTKPDFHEYANFEPVREENQL